MLTHPKIPIGEIVYLQDGIRPFGQSRHWSPVFRNPWQIIAAHNRAYERPHQPPLAMRGGHLFTVKSLRDGRVQQVADWIIQRCLDL